MRKLSITVAAAAAILALNSIGCSANAVTASGNTLPNAAKNFSPIHETACRGWGRWCGPGLSGPVVHTGAGAAPVGKVADKEGSPAGGLLSIYTECSARDGSAAGGRHGPH
jgi:hypothetical protein